MTSSRIDESNPRFFSRTIVGGTSTGRLRGQLECRRLESRPGKFEIPLWLRHLDHRTRRGVNPANGGFVAISNGSVYLITGATRFRHQGRQAGRFTTGMMKDGKSRADRQNAQSADHCGFRCQSGLPDNRMTVTFKAVDGRAQQINDMLALGGPKQ